MPADHAPYSMRRLTAQLDAVHEASKQEVAEFLMRHRLDIVDAGLVVLIRLKKAVRDCVDDV